MKASSVHRPRLYEPAQPLEDLVANDNPPEHISTAQVSSLSECHAGGNNDRTGMTGSGFAVVVELERVRRHSVDEAGSNGRTLRPVGPDAAETASERVELQSDGHIAESGGAKSDTNGVDHPVQRRLSHGTVVRYLFGPRRDRLGQNRGGGHGGHASFLAHTVRVPT